MVGQAPSFVVAVVDDVGFVVVGGLAEVFVVAELAAVEVADKCTTGDSSRTCTA